MWEILLDGLERRYQRREGVSDEDLASVRETVNKIKRQQTKAETPPLARPVNDSPTSGGGAG